MKQRISEATPVDFKGRILFDVPMKDYTSIKIGGSADVMAFPKDESDLIKVIRFASHKGFPVFIIGRGTNLLVRDNGIRGVVINISEGFKDISWPEELSQSDECVRIEAGSGVQISELSSLCRDRGISGLEFGVGIPGTVGGGVFMNAGAYGGEMKNVVEQVDAIGLNGQKYTFDNASLKFSYRRCEIPADKIITRAYLKLKQDDPEEINKRMKEFKERRKGTQSINLPNAGSIFKNPEGTSAGRVIDEAGLKGITVGGAQISEVHGNYIVNRGGATAMDVLSLIATVRDRVFKTKGVLLEIEIKVVGED